MKKLIADLHMHTLVSGHAYGTIREMAQAAAEQSLQLIGITEHAPGIPGTVHPFYYLNLDVLPSELYGVKLLNGCEINVLDDGSLSLEEQFIRHLDYALVGIHTPCYQSVGAVKNTENLIRCMQHPKVRFVSHPDDDRTPLDYEELAKAALACHVALEVNNSSLSESTSRVNAVQNYHKLLPLCAREGVPIIVSSDAHDPSWVGRFENAQALLEEIGFPEELILTNDLQKTERFLFGTNQS